MEKIKAIFYFINEWWHENFFTGHAAPQSRGPEELDRIYLERKRFLFENFGEFGQGEEEPEMDGQYANLFVKWGMDIISYVLGGELFAHDAGGYCVVPQDKERLGRLKPVDIADTDFAEWIVRRKGYLEERYGSAGQMQILETSLNVATRLGGQEFYIALGTDKPFASHLLETIAETTALAYRFFCKEFVMPDVNLTNCAVNHISSDMYEEMCLKNDIYLAEDTRDLFPHTKRHVLLHSCDLPADRLVDSYAKVPRVYRFEASYRTDVKRFYEKMPDAYFAAFVNPVDLVQLPEEELARMLSDKTRDGVREWIFWGIDPYCSAGRLKKAMRFVQQACSANGFEAELEVTPFNFDELEWSFPKWQGDGVYSIEGAKRLPVDVN